jgi:hypothetical protein
MHSTIIVVIVIVVIIIIIPSSPSSSRSQGDRGTLKFPSTSAVMSCGVLAKISSTREAADRHRRTEVVGRRS